ncbi:DksA/TraR family C4-type zinc finger protein [Onishia taeanensis]
MAGGWSKDGAVQEQIDSTVEDALARARRELPRGKSRRYCEECEAAIPQARREAVPGVRLCMRCQSERDQQRSTGSGYNRRASKDSQLR